MIDPNPFLDDTLAELRALYPNDPLRVLEQWMVICPESPAGGAAYTQNTRESARAYARLARVRQFLADRTRHHHRDGGGYVPPYRIANRVRDSRYSPIQRGTPLHRRGKRGGDRSLAVAQEIANRRRINAVRTLFDHPCSQGHCSAFFHLIALWDDYRLGAVGERPADLKQYVASHEITQWCIALAANFHANAAPLVKVRNVSQPFFCGRARPFRLIGKEGQTLGWKKGAGVWVRAVSRPDHDGVRWVTVVFERSSRKRQFEVRVPMDCDPETIDLRPPQPPVRRDIPHAQVNLATLNRLNGSPVHPPSLAEIANASHAGARAGSFWDARQVRWRFASGVWIERIDLDRGLVSLCVETETTCTVRDIPLPQACPDLDGDFQLIFEGFYRFSRNDRVMYLGCRGSVCVVADSFVNCCTLLNRASADVAEAA